MEEKQYKGLIIQNNPFSKKTGNGKTIASMFFRWEAENLAQIYVSELEVDRSICKHFYQITDREVFKSFLGKKQVGKEKTEYESTNINDAAVVKNKRTTEIKNLINTSSFMALVRDYIWKKSNWNTPDFNAWLDMINPDFVFLSAGNMAFFFEVAQYVARKYNIPLFIHIGDDYYIYRKGSLWKNIQRKRMSKHLQRAIESSSGIIAICDKMARVFKERYGGNYFVCMNNVDVGKEYSPIVKKEKGQTIKLVYAGNLGLNRWQILSLIGEALNELKAEGINSELCIYSSYLPSEAVLKQLNKLPELKFCGSVFAEELDKVKDEADILVHVESFEKKYYQLTYTAMSTKVSEYLNSERPILCVGPKEAASVEFLEENGVALVANRKSKELIKQQILYYLSDFEQIKKMTKKGKELAKDKFSLEVNSMKIYEIIQQECKEFKRD